MNKMWKAYRKQSRKKRWSCDDCNVKFSHRGTFRIHKRSHAGKKPYICEICNSRFLVPSSLQLHLRTSSVCQQHSINPKIYSIRNKEHMEPSSKQRSYKCELCCQLFPRWDTTVNHIKRFHRIYNEKFSNRNISLLMTANYIPHDGLFQVYPELNGQTGSDPVLKNSIADTSGAGSGTESNSTIQFSRSESVADDGSCHEDQTDAAACQDSDLGEIMCVRGSDGAQAMVFSMNNKSIESSDVDDPDNGKGSPLSKRNEDPDSDWSVKKEMQNSSDSESEISAGEWEKLNCALARNQSNSVTPTAGAEEDNSTVADVDEEEPKVCKEEPMSPPKTDMETGSDNGVKEGQGYEESTSNSRYFTWQSSKQFAEVMNLNYQPGTSSGDKPPVNEGSPGLDNEQFLKSWTLGNIKTHSQRVSRRKNTMNKIFNWKAYTKVEKTKRNFLKCHMCSAALPDENALNEHIKRHEGTETNYLKCKHCPKVFRSNHTLTNHEKLHSGYFPFHCNVCGKGFYQRANIKVHMRSHTGERPFKCEICGKAYSVRISLAHHSMSHEENIFKCDRCKFCFAKEEDLKEHYKVHASQKIHECPRCNKKFLKAYLLEFHLQRSCEDKRYICDQCNKEFSCLDYLRTHQRVHTGEKPFGCELCGKHFSQSANLTKHLKIHYNIRSFACDICGNTFVEKASMISHRRTHTGEKPHNCDICGVGFSSPSALVIHVRQHTGEKPFPCDQCEKRFSSSGKLKSHYRTHTGEKPYKCKLCDKSFSLSTGLTRHTRTHTGEKPHRCEICGERFMRKDRLRKHWGIHQETQIHVAGGAVAQ